LKVHIDIQVFDITGTHDNQLSLYQHTIVRFTLQQWLYLYSRFGICTRLCIL